VQLSFNPGRIDPTNPAFKSSRKPLVGEFLFNGRKVFIVNNHFNSKGGDAPLYGENQPPVFISEEQRLQQAEVVNAFVKKILDLDPQANVIVLGDLNDFQWSQPLTILEGSQLYNLVDTLPVNEQYTYIFEGNAETLDQILVSQNLFKNASMSFTVMHLNSEFFDTQRISDHDPVVARFILQ
jgi:predicted extracellular nuclease